MGCTSYLRTAVQLTAMTTISTPAVTYHIRTIRPEDNATVAHIIRRVMTEFGCVGPGFSIMDPEVDQMYEAYQGEDSAFFVVDGPGGIVGCAGIAPLAGGDHGICELKKMYFLDEARGHGLGRRMLELCIEKARELGFRQMYLETVGRMEAANQLYRKLGFELLPGQIGATGHGGCELFYIREL